MWLGCARPNHGLLAVRRLRYDLDLRSRLEQDFEALAKEPFIVGDQKFDRHKLFCFGRGPMRAPAMRCLIQTKPVQEASRWIWTRWYGLRRVWRFSRRGAKVQFGRDSGLTMDDRIDLRAARARRFAFPCRRRSATKRRRFARMGWSGDRNRG